jgi:hypothetical protein
VVNPSHSITGLDRPLGLKEFGASKISRPLAHEGGKVFSPTHHLSSHPRRIKMKYSAQIKTYNFHSSFRNFSCVKFHSNNVKSHMKA